MRRARGRQLLSPVSVVGSSATTFAWKSLSRVLFSHWNSLLRYPSSHPYHHYHRCRGNPGRSGGVADHLFRDCILAYIDLSFRTVHAGNQSKCTTSKSVPATSVSVYRALRSRIVSRPKDQSYAFHGVLKSLEIELTAPDYAKSVGQIYGDLFNDLLPGSLALKIAQVGPRIGI
jgi:hypothetical protein